MEHAVKNNLSDINYESELIPPLIFCNNAAGVVRGYNLLILRK